MKAKNIIISSLLLILGASTFAQNIMKNPYQLNGLEYPNKYDPQVAVNNDNVQTFKISYSKTTHIISPEPILYVDVSSPYVSGDLPEPNIVRLKPVPATETQAGISPDQNFTITIVTKAFVMMYKFSFSKNENSNFSDLAYIITIDPNKAIQLNTNNDITESDYRRLALLAIGNKRTIYDVKKKSNGMELWLANVYVIGDIILLDIGAKNHTNLQYDINDVNFSLIDRHTSKASITQSIQLTPLYQFTSDKNAVIKNKWHNYYIFKKFTYPAKKVLDIRLSENQISGRPIEIKVDYNHILESQKLLE